MILRNETSTNGVHVLFCQNVNKLGFVHLGTGGIPEVHYLHVTNSIAGEAEPLIDSTYVLFVIRVTNKNETSSYITRT